MVERRREISEVTFNQNQSFSDLNCSGSNLKKGIIERNSSYHRTSLEKRLLNVKRSCLDQYRLKVYICSTF